MKMETKHEVVQKWQSEKMFDEFKNGLLRVFVDSGDVYAVSNFSVEAVKIDLEEFLKEWEKLL